MSKTDLRIDEPLQSLPCIYAKPLSNNGFNSNKLISVNDNQMLSGSVVVRKFDNK